MLGVTLHEISRGDSCAVLLQPGFCEDSVRSGLVEGDVENAAGFSMPVPNHPQAVPAACSHDTCPHCDRLLLSSSPAKIYTKELPAYVLPSHVKEPKGSKFLADQSQEKRSFPSPSFHLH